MSTPRTDRPDGAPEPVGDVPARAGVALVGRPRTEPALAVTAAVTALLADALDDSGNLWVVLDIAGLLGAGIAVALLLRGFGISGGRPSLTELATSAVTAAISGAVWLLAGHGPQARVGTLLLGTAAVMGAVLTLLVLGGALSRYRRESTGAAPTSPPDVMRPREPGAPGDLPTAAGRAATIITLLTAAVAVASVARDVIVR
jgi:hypothetical protein